MAAKDITLRAPSALKNINNGGTPPASIGFLPEQLGLIALMGGMQNVE